MINRTETIPCIDCGQSFERRSPRRFRCDGCRQKHQARQLKLNQARQKAQRKAARKLSRKVHVN